MVPAHPSQYPLDLQRTTRRFYGQYRMISRLWFGSYIGMSFTASTLAWQYFAYPKTLASNNSLQLCFLTSNGVS